MPADTPREQPWSRWAPWVLRACWIATGVLGAGAVEAAVDGRSDAVRAVAQVGAGAGWIVGVATMAVSAATSLTGCRIVVPVAAVLAAWTAVTGAAATESGPFLAVALLTVAIAYSAEIGQGFVQASAYGDEQRFPLRPPIGYAAAAVLAWGAWTAALLAGPLLLAASSWLAGAVVTALAVALTVLAVPRWHRLARRWIVLVPAGFVLHDPVVLSDTLMLKRSEIARLRLAPADTEALDLTGPTSGHAVEVTTRRSVTVVTAPAPGQPNGRAVHLTACLTAPSRPGRMLAAARSRRLPVG